MAAPPLGDQPGRHPSRRTLARLPDRGAAGRELGLADDLDGAWWMVPGGWLPGFWIRRLHELGARSGWMVPLHRRALRQAAGDSPLVVVRADDYPRWDRPLEEFIAFDALLV